MGTVRVPVESVVGQQHRCRLMRRARRVPHPQRPRPLKEHPQRRPHVHLNRSENVHLWLHREMRQETLRWRCRLTRSEPTAFAERRLAITRVYCALIEARQLLIVPYSRVRPFYLLEPRKT